MSVDDSQEYTVIDVTDENGVAYCMVFVDTHTIDGVTYSLLVDEEEFLHKFDEPRTLHVVKHVIEDGEEFLVGIDDEEMDRVIDELEDHLMFPE